MMKLKRPIAVVFLVLWLASLACNLPMPPGAPSQPGYQQTLEALGTSAPPRSQPRPGATDVPDLRQPGMPTASAEAPPADLIPPPAPSLPTIIPGGAGHGVLIPGAPVRVNGHFQYSSQPGDTWAGLAGRFGVPLEQISSAQAIPQEGLIPIGQMLMIPDVLGELHYSRGLLPDSEIVYSPSVAGFSTADFIQQAGGFLSTYSEQVEQETLTGAQIVDRVAQEMSTNSRLLLGILEYRSGWVFGQPNQRGSRYPIGFQANTYTGLYKELVLTSRQLTIGYYGWRSGKTVDLEFIDQRRLRMSPTVNAGTMSIAYLFSKLYKPEEWVQELYDPAHFLVFYQERFGSAWDRAAQVEPLLPDGLSQPVLELPFQPGERWSLTGGPHAAWGIGSPLGGLDFAPVSGEKGCAVSSFWITASAPGLVTRSGGGMVILDLDGDGFEQTGWVLMYLHVATKDRVPAGTWLNVDDRIGHASCEGGYSTGAHVHLVRKYNGEWMGAEGPIPYVLSGWRAWPGAKPYLGTLTKDDQVVTARSDGSRTTSIFR